MSRTVEDIRELDVRVMFIFTTTLFSRTLVAGEKTVTCEDSQICIQELTTDNYLKVTRQAGKVR